MGSARVSIGVGLILGLTVVGTAATAAVHKVNPGESIQAAVDLAAPGDKVVVMPGAYIGTGTGSASVRITKSLKLIGKSKPGAKVRILPGPGETDGILVEPENPGDPDVDGVLIKGFSVDGFPNNGIWLRHVQNFKIQNNESINNLENGIWPTLSANGLVKKNVSYGSLDSALWIEASENVRVIKNDLSFSPTGLEITISKNIEATKNHVHNNSVGIGLYHPSAAGLDPLGEDGDWEISNNYVHDNNNPNTVTGGLVSALPPGGGILVLGADRVNIKRNRIENNDFFGIAVVDYCLAVASTSFNCTTSPPDVEPAPDDNTYVKNTLVNNGTDPEPFGGFEAFAADITYLVVNFPVVPESPVNCFAKNTYDTFKGTGGAILANNCN